MKPEAPNGLRTHRPHKMPNSRLCAFKGPSSRDPPGDCLVHHEIRHSTRYAGKPAVDTASEFGSLRDSMVPLPRTDAYAVARRRRAVRHCGPAPRSGRISRIRGCRRIHNDGRLGLRGATPWCHTNQIWRHKKFLILLSFLHLKRVWRRGRDSQPQAPETQETQ